MGMRDPQVLSLVLEANGRVLSFMTAALVERLPTFATALEGVARASFLSMRETLPTRADDAKDVERWVELCEQELVRLTTYTSSLCALIYF